MAIPIVIVVILVCIAAAILWTKRRNKPQDASATPTPKQIAGQMEFQSEMRMRFLKGSPAEFGIDPKAGGEGAWGVLMEIGFAKGVATLVCLRDGSASLYLGRGGGIIGGGSHESVRKAVASFLSSAGTYVGTMTAADSYPMPEVGRVRFYVLTPSGVVTADEEEQPLGEGIHQLSPLFYAGQDVITELRLLSEQGR